MDASSPTRTPLYAMSDQQLLWIALEDDMASSERKAVAEQLLLERLGDEFEHRKVPVLEAATA